MAVSELGDGRDGVESRVLGQRVRDDLERLRERAEAVGVRAHQRVRMRGQTKGKLNLCK